MYNEGTIIALSSAPGSGAIAIIRLSGEDASRDQGIQRGCWQLLELGHARCYESGKHDHSFW